jgi:hypothetical protein
VATAILFNNGGLNEQMQPIGWDMETFTTLSYVLSLIKFPFTNTTSPALKLGQDQEHPVRQIMAPIEIANSIAFLASDLSSHINGVILPIDDAWSAA